MLQLSNLVPLLPFSVEDQLRLLESFHLSRAITSQHDDSSQYGKLCLWNVSENALVWQYDTPERSEPQKYQYAIDMLDYDNDRGARISNRRVCSLSGKLAISNPVSDFSSILDELGSLYLWLQFCGHRASRSCDWDFFFPAQQQPGSCASKQCRQGVISGDSWRYRCRQKRKELLFHQLENSVLYHPKCMSVQIAYSSQTWLMYSWQVDVFYDKTGVLTHDSILHFARNFPTIAITGWDKHGRQRRHLIGLRCCLAACVVKEGRRSYFLGWWSDIQDFAEDQKRGPYIIVWWESAMKAPKLSGAVVVGYLPKASSTWWNNWFRLFF